MNTSAKALGILAAAALVLAGIYWWQSSAAAPVQPPNTLTENEANGTSTAPAVSIIAENLEIPWDIAFLPEGDMLVTERPGRLLRITENGARTELLSDIGTHTGEGGLLGLILHPNFESNQLLYLYFTQETMNGMENRIERYRLQNTSLTNKTVILEDIPGAQYHDGGRMEFGPDGFLYVTVGDATNARQAQNPQSIEGTVLRIHDDGSIPADNPFGNAVYSYGHRNSQGLAWDSAGRLWSTEHGRSGVRSGLDEINLIRPGSNYGWPDSEGDSVESGTMAPALHSGSSDTWAPASAAYRNGSLFFGGLRGEALYEAVLNGTEVVELKEHFKGEFGRIRTVRVGPDGLLYLTTSNRDGRGSAQSGDDKIIRVNPAALD